MDRKWNDLTEKEKYEMQTGQSISSPHKYTELIQPEIIGSHLVYDSEDLL